MAKSKPFNGHASWNAWNVFLWINNDEGLYRTALLHVKRETTKADAAKVMLCELAECGITHTPDGAPYSVTTIKAAMRGM